MIVLGRDCTFSGAGINNSAVRNVSVSISAIEVTGQRFGVRPAYHWGVGWDATLEVEVLEDPQQYTNLEFGTPVQVTSGPLTGQFIVAGINRSEPLDDVATVRVTLKPCPS